MRKLAALAIIVAVWVYLLTVALGPTLEGTAAVVFGWWPFLERVLSQVQPDGPSVVVGVAAILLFAGGVHWLGRSWRRTAGGWKLRWTAAVVLSVVILFAAGISVIGVVHQVGWLATSKQPLLSEYSRMTWDSESAARQIAAGVNDYNGPLPPGGTFSPTGEMLHSWETHILPYMWYSPAGIDMTRPWTDPQNQRYFKCVVPAFINGGFRTPALEDGEGYGLSHYAANARVLGANTRMKLSDITDGAANTIAIGEVNAGFKPWGHPINWRDPAAGLNRGAKGFGGPPGASGVYFVMADGSVRFVGNGVDPAVLRALGTPSAGD